MKSAFILVALLLALVAHAQDATLTLDGSKPGPRLSPWLHGIFFEEINHAGDGGLNPEKLRGTASWTIVGKGQVAMKSLDSNVPGNFVEVRVRGAERGGIRNDGYWGIGVERGKKYGFRARLTEGARVRVALVAPDGSELASALVKATGEVAVELIPKRTEPKASLVLSVAGGDGFRLENASLLPRETFGKSQVRKDLGELIAGMQPSFVRFPGGCFVEGDKLANKFDWKTTLGKKSGRTPNQCLWGYKCTNGLGYHEFLQWSEDMKSEPLFVVNCGMSHTDIVPMEKMGAVVQDALDAIEYANGDSKTTRWGAERAKNGHPKPFGLKLIEIGNENGGPKYEERYKLIYEAIKKKYPEVNLIACDWGGLPKSAPVEISDEHFYTSPQQMQNLSRRYDNYPRTGPKIYLGEYAVTQGCGQGNLIAALSEAAFITGLERNSDVVSLASYAPLLVNSSNRAWNPDAIVFDSQRSFGTPSYWVQRMFSTNRGEQVVPATLDVRRVKAPAPPGGVGVGTWRTDATFADVKINGSPALLTPSRGTWAPEGNGWRQTELADDRRAYGGDRRGSGDYTLTLRARKSQGEEGFLVLFRVGTDDDYLWWNLGGWGNTRHNIERAIGGGKELVARDVPGKIEPDRWYDIKIECEGERVRCYLDNVLIHDVTLAPPPPPFYAVVTRDEKNQQLLVKLVNIQERPADFRLVLNGIGALTGRGEALTLSGNDPNAENSFEKPLRLAPVKTPLTGARGDFTYRAPAWSVSILRLDLKK